MNKPPIIKDNTPEEEAEIQRQIAEDPDTWATAPDAKVLKRGRTKPASALFEEWRQNPEFVAEYDALEEEFAEAAKRIDQALLPKDN